MAFEYAPLVCTVRAGQLDQMRICPFDPNELTGIYAACHDGPILVQHDWRPFRRKALSVDNLWKIFGTRADKIIGTPDAEL